MISNTNLNNANIQINHLKDQNDNLLNQNELLEQKISSTNLTLEIS